MQSLVRHDTKSTQRKKKADKLDFIKIFKVWKYEDNEKTTPQNVRKCLQIHYLIKGLYPEFLKSKRVTQ